MSRARRAVHAEVKQVGKFGVVGALNTVMDFIIYNLLHFKLGWALIQSNIVSTTIAMIFSFYMNKKLVFRHHEGSHLKQGIIFFAVTAFGLYVLQTGTIQVLTEVWTEPLQLTVAFAHVLDLDRFFSDTFIVNNCAKALGTIISLTWNYLMYKKVVFRV
jgi:putative flippase GtrA